MQSNQLKRNHPNTKRMIVARGGKRGKTAGRGGKGQSARAGNKRRPEWRDIIKRIPKLRGRGKSSHKSFQEMATIVNLSTIETAFSANDTITPTILIEKGIIRTISGNIPYVKILGDGEVTKAFKISGCAISDSAREKIIKAGGSIVDLASRTLVKTKTEAQIKKAAMPKKEKVAKVEKKEVTIEVDKSKKAKVVDVDKQKKTVATEKKTKTSTSKKKA